MFFYLLSFVFDDFDVVIWAGIESLTGEFTPEVTPQFTSFEDHRGNNRSETNKV